jgi:TonB family protein
MNVKIAFAVSALAVLLCSGGALRAQDAPPSPPPMQEAPPETKPATPPRVRIGGNVQAAKMIHQVQPIYPQIALTAHVQGTVVLHVIVAKDGTILDVQYVSGPALLMRSAMTAVRQWRYAPTLLNGEPVEVDTKVSVVFALGDSKAAPSGDQDSAPKEIDPQFKADVMELLEVMNFRELFANSVKEAAKSVREQMVKVMPATPNRDKIIDEYFEKLGGLIQRPDALEGLVRIYAKYLTDDDIKAATKFYQTPSGKRVLEVLPKIQGEAMQWGEHLAAANAKDILVELCHEYPELKGQADFCPADSEKSSQSRYPEHLDWSAVRRAAGTD